MTIALVGNNDGPLALLRSVREANVEVALVGLQHAPPRAVRERYEEHDVERYVEGFGEKRLLDRLKPLDVDVLVNCFCNFRFHALLKAYDVLNVHLAPLPRYRGRHPVQWALINGEREFGATIHRMEKEWDAGAILWQGQVAVPRGASVKALRRRLLEDVQADFGSFLEHYADGAITSQPNADEDATYVARRFPRDSRLTDWRDRDRIVRKVMALRSEDYPAYLEIGEEQIVTRHAEAGARRYTGLAAPFVCATGPTSLTIACEEGRTVVLGALEPTPPPVHVNQRPDFV